ncbi:MAG: SMC-Scp complex subunit ScpB [Deltaproteobacteria bacterium]
MSVAGSEEEKDGVSGDAPETEVEPGEELESAEVESGEETESEPAEDPAVEAVAATDAAVEPGVLETADQEIAAEDEAENEPIEAILEAILFAAAEPIPLQRLSRLFQGRGRGSVKEALSTLKTTLEESGRGIRLVEVSSGFQLRSGAEHAPWLRRFFAEKPPRLSRALLETVAIIAYRQPVTRGEIEAIRGVNCDAILTALINRVLVVSTGRRDTPGRPVEYGTTAEFLELFTMKNLGQLPPLPDAESLATLLKEETADEGSEDSGDSDDEGGPSGGYGAEAAEGALAELEDEDQAEVVSTEADVAEEAEPRAAAMAAAAGAGAAALTLLIESSNDGQNDGIERASTEDSESRGDRLAPGVGGDDS